MLRRMRSSRSGAATALRSSAFCMPKLSSAMPSAVVKMRASTMLAPLSAIAPAIFMNRPGWSGVNSSISVRSRKRSIWKSRVRRLPAASARAHQRGVAAVHVGREAQPVARILTLDEGAHRVVGPVARAPSASACCAAAIRSLAAARCRCPRAPRRSRDRGCAAAGPSSRSRRSARPRGCRRRS